MNALIQKARESGKCPPSLLAEDRPITDPDNFGNAINQLLHSSGFYLSSDPHVVDKFAACLQKTSSVTTTQLSSLDGTTRKAVLAQRRCILLAVAGSTSSENNVLVKVVANGYLNWVKAWLDEILNGSVGNMDLLLHMLTNLVGLPVTKSVVKNSGMGKAIGAIEKSFQNSPNVAAIKERVDKIKEAWNASVKARKAQDTGAAAPAVPVAVSSFSVGVKRPSPSVGAGKNTSTSPTAKKVKTEDSKKSASNFTSLLKRVSRPAEAFVKTEQKTTESMQSKSARNGSVATLSTTKSLSSSPGDTKVGLRGLVQKKKSSNRVKWADHFGGELEVARLIEADGTDIVSAPPVAANNNNNNNSNSVSWMDRKRRDRAREKELLARVKKTKLMDDDDDDVPIVAAGLKATIAWHSPALLPDRPDVVRPTLNSQELAAQNERSNVVTRVYYFSEIDVPSSPAPLTDIEQALDMTAQSSAVVASIPFFVPQQPEAAPAPAVHQTQGIYADTTAQSAESHQPQYSSPSAPVGATPDIVQALGLPMFLVGQSVQALQTLAGSPGLLSTLVDANGVYDQPRLMSLVQTLSGSNHQQDPSSMYSSQGGASNFSAAPGGMNQYSSSSFGNNSTSTQSFRGKSDEGNLHISGYGPTTTQTDIITMFLPYVQVDEVVLKGNFAFVNTSDPVNAARAKEALQGALLNGMPIRINPAQRKSKEGSSYGNSTSSTSSYGPGTGTTSFAANNTQPQPPTPSNPPNSFTANLSAPPQAVQHVNVDAVRDDRGNPATKNLFVAGYGQGTTEQQLRDLFNQHAQVIGVVLKGNFTFVNTAHKAEAVKAREMLQGQTVNGGSLRINFAKETGRLGTSFDLTYNERSGPNARRPGQGPGPGPSPGPGPGQGLPNYYGRN